ncbi:MAG: DNA-binding response regulator [Armatimonadetes bacterium]|nr:DNA-binding response regulator [Armatimonadota bacterium]
MPTIQVLVADDEMMLRRLLVRRLSGESDLKVVGEAENGKQAVELALQLRPDVIVMDLNMPQLSGAQATERISAELPDTRVVILTSLGELATMARYAGASDCLDKSCTPEELIAVIRRVYAGRRGVAAPGAPADHGNSIELLASRFGLTDYEKVVLAKAVSTDMTVHQIATALSADEGKPVTDSSVKHALDRVMTKLKVEPRTRAAVVKRVLEMQRGR